MLMLACVVASYADPDAAGDAAAYGGMSFNRELPYVPRYRYVLFSPVLSKIKRFFISFLLIFYHMFVHQKTSFITKV